VKAAEIEVVKERRESVGQWVEWSGDEFEFGSVRSGWCDLWKGAILQLFTDFTPAILADLSYR
jgi:hypothetical protein